MKVGIIGQGQAGLMLAIMLKKNIKDVDVTIIDKNQNVGKKLLATGNGRCNLANLKIKDNSYNSKEVQKIVKDFDAKKQIEFYKSIGIMTRSLNDLVYPFSLSAKNYVEYLERYAKELKIKLINNESLKDYEVSKDKVKVTTNKKVFVFDYLVFASGNESAPQLGGDASILNILKKHGYEIKETKPGLCPIRTIEQTKNIENERWKCKVSLNIDKEKVYKEDGEVLFKKDGLSGIAIFNCASLIARSKKFKKAIITLDLMPDLDLSEIESIFSEMNFVSKESFLYGIFTKTMAAYIHYIANVKNPFRYTATEIKKIAKTVKELTFNYKESYDFKDCQVAIGGLELSNLNSNLFSKTENNVGFAGELLNADGLCGGFNLMFATASANKIAKFLSK